MRSTVRRHIRRPRRAPTRHTRSPAEQTRAHAPPRRREIRVGRQPCVWRRRGLAPSCPRVPPFIDVASHGVDRQTHCRDVGWVRMRSTATRSPCTTLKTPFGIRLRDEFSHNIEADGSFSGASDERVTVAMRGEHPHGTIAGKLKGDPATTPSGDAANARSRRSRRSAELTFKSEQFRRRIHTSDRAHSPAACSHLRARRHRSPSSLAWQPRVRARTAQPCAWRATSPQAGNALRRGDRRSIRHAASRLRRFGRRRGSILPWRCASPITVSVNPVVMRFMRPLNARQTRCDGSLPVCQINGHLVKD